MRTAEYDGFGRSVSRYVDRKRVVSDEDMGPLVATDMNRAAFNAPLRPFYRRYRPDYELAA